LSLITFDAETYYDKDYSIKKMSTEAYVRDPRFQLIGASIKIDEGVSRWFAGSDAHYAITHIPWHKHGVICHNTLFDGSILSWHFGARPRLWVDTLSMARPFHGLTIGGSLAALASHYAIGVKGDDANRAVGKRLEDFSPEDLATYGAYCCNDVELTYKLFKIFLPRITPSEMRVINLLLRMFTEPVLVLDPAVLETHLQKVQARRWELLQKIEGGSKVINSNPQFADLLRLLGVDPPMKISKKTGLPTYAFAKTDISFKALEEHPDPRVQLVVGIRLGTKTSIEESRTKAFLEINKRGTLPVPIGYYNGHTGRAGGLDGINLQNLPRGGALRRSICAPPGMRLVAGDSSQIEARINAYLSRQDDLVEAFRQGRDVYSEFASDIYGRKVDRKRTELDAEGKPYAPDFKEGFVGKTSILSMGFGVGWEKFQNTLRLSKPPVVLTEEESRRAVNLYRRRYAAIKHFWDIAGVALPKLHQSQPYEFGRNNLLRVEGDGIQLPNGMALRYPGLHFDGSDYTYMSRREVKKIYGAMVVENVVQALARIIVFDQMLVIAKAWPVVLTVHDEVVCCVPERDTEACKAFMAHAMTVAPTWAPELPVACDVNDGANYAECK
jgi:DNA polymerase